MHGIEVVYDSLHRLAGRAVGLCECVLLRKALELSGNLLAVFFGEKFELLRFILSGGFELRHLAGSCLRSGANRLDAILGVLVVGKKLSAAAEICAITLVIGLCNARRHTVVEVRYGLTAVLIILVGLDRDARERGISRDIVRLADEAVAGGEAALEEL